MADDNEHLFSGYDRSDYEVGANDTTLPPLQPYRPAAYLPKRPPVTTSLGHSASDARLNGFTSDVPTNSSPSDPHDFYRRRTPHNRELAQNYNASEGGAKKSKENMIAASRSPHRLSTAYNSPMATRFGSRYDTRITPSPTSDIPSITGAKSNPQLGSIGRNRQSSLQELVNRFNQTPDEVPPLPTKPGSRSTSATTSSATANGPRPFRTRTPVESTRSAHSVTVRTPLSGNELSRNSPVSPRRRKNQSENANPTSFGTRAQRKPPTVANNSSASQSMTDLVPKLDAAPRRPLFGEVLSITTSSNAGYGISGTQRRRGSEGSMHTPNPMFAEERSNLPARVSPSSPTAWYLGVTPSLDGIDLDKPVPARPPGMHLRSRSDFSGTYSGTYSNAPLASSVGKTITIMSPTQEAPSPLISPTSKRNSQSRIPISTRRASVASDSGNSSSAPSRAPSAASFRKPATKAFSALANSKSLVSPSSSNCQNVPNSNPRTSRRGNLSPLRYTPGASPPLTAYISESPPAKSPPLRSSRPRQPVSTATTSASRARAAERLANSNNQNTAKTRERRSRNWPELGNVDFAARRKQIEQAVTKTVKENEQRKAVEDEKKRMSMVLDARLHREATEHNQNVASESQPHVTDEQPESQDDKTVSPDMEDERYATPPNEMPRADGELTIKTSHISNRPTLDLNQEDSPTLGMANNFLDLRKLHNASPGLPSDSEPTSAVTAGTLFDNDPQDGLSGLNHEHDMNLDQSDRNPIPDDDHTNLPNSQNLDGHITNEHKTTNDHHTVLNNIMHLRATSPDEHSSVRSSNAVGVHQAEDSTSDRDDQESIQIMLGETPITERASEAHQLPSRSLDEFLDQPTNRWSADSWTSSINTRDRQSLDREREMPMERIDEHAPQQAEGLAQVSFSTTVVDDGGLPWSPSQTSMLSGHTNLDSDSYSTINRVLDSYHDPSLMSPESMRDFQQQLMTQSPNLARAAGWDPKKMTQLYLQSLGRAPYAQPSAVPDPLRYSGKTSEEPGLTSSQTQAEELQDGQQGNDEFEPEDVDYDNQRAEYEDETSARESLQVTSMGNHQRASLNHPDDFANTSPSLLDWFSSQRDAETPTDDKPLPISKDWEDLTLEVLDHTAGRRTRTPDSSREQHIQLPEIHRAGDPARFLDIDSPHDSPNTARPKHTLRDLATSTSKLRQSDYDYHQPYTMSSDSLPNQIHRKCSNEPTHQTGFAKPPVPTADSFSRALERSSSDGPAVPAEPSNGQAPTPEQKRLTRRRHILKELVDTEASYGQDMKVVTDIYKGTSSQVIESVDDSKALFGNADQVMVFSQTFFDALKQAAKSVYIVPRSKRWRSKRDSDSVTTASGNTDDQSSIVGFSDLGDEERDRMTFIGEVFLTHMSEMEKIYRDYLRNYDNANAKLILLQTNPTIKIWLNECRTWAQDLTSAWDLDSLLVKPLQRILKYPLLLKELLEVTPEDHPDFKNLEMVARETVGMSRRINDAKKRIDMVGQLSAQRKKGLGLKAFTRRTEKLKQQVGLTDSFQDEAYDNVAEKFGIHFFQVQVVMRDIEMYTSDVQNFVNRFNDFVLAIEAHIDVGQSTYPEVESKWRKFRICMREITVTALTEHVRFLLDSGLQHAPY